MIALKISEAGTGQFPMVDHAAEIGWEPLTPGMATIRSANIKGSDATTTARRKA